MKAERDSGPTFFWILAGIPHPGSAGPFQYYVIPSRDMAYNVSEIHERWLKAPGIKGQEHKDSRVRAVELPPRKSFNGWDISRYLNKWELIDAKLKDGTPA